MLACGTHGGATVHRIDLRGGGLDVSILTFGATIQQLRVHGPRGPRHVVLGFDSCEEYLKQRMYMGCVVGRFANRIAAGRFALDGAAHQLSRNENGNHLHGGVEGFSHKVWSIDLVAERAVSLSLVSPAGEEGYPGTLMVGCYYSIEDERCLRIALTAVTDAPTIVNLATHSYFNLDGQGDTLRHRLEIPADAYLPAMMPASRPVNSGPSPARISISARCARCGRRPRNDTTTRTCSRRRQDMCARRHASKAPKSRWRSGRPSRASSSSTARRCDRWQAAIAVSMRRTAVSASSRNVSPILPIEAPSPTARSIPASSTGRSPSIGLTAHDPEKWAPVFGQDHAQEELESMRAASIRRRRGSTGSPPR